LFHRDLKSQVSNIGVRHARHRSLGDLASPAFDLQYIVVDAAEGEAKRIEVQTSLDEFLDGDWIDG
jgi:hypothetical protein